MSLGPPVPMYTTICQGCGIVWFTSSPTLAEGDDNCRDRSKVPTVKGCGGKLPAPIPEVRRP